MSQSFYIVGEKCDAVTFFSHESLVARYEKSQGIP